MNNNKDKRDKVLSCGCKQGAIYNVELNALIAHGINENLNLLPLIIIPLIIMVIKVKFMRDSFYF